MRRGRWARAFERTALRYAREVMDLMAAYPGRDWKMAHIVRYVCTARNETRRQKVRIGVHRVVAMLIETGHVERDPPGKYGSYALYRWAAKP